MLEIPWYCRKINDYGCEQCSFLQTLHMPSEER